MVDGAFDPLHAGHIEYFRAATALGSPLLCNIAPDRYVRAKHPALLPVEQRVEILDGKGTLYLLDYDMIRTEEGWKINGVRFVESPPLAT